MASALLGEPSRGCHVVLRKLACDPAFQQLRILDLMFDRVIERELQHLPHYVKIVRQGDDVLPRRSEREVPVNFASMQRVPFRDAVFDTIAARDVLRVVPDISAFLADCFRVLRSGGSLVLQDRYRWPLPDAGAVPATEAASAAAQSGQGREGQRPAGEIGARLLADLRKAGFMSYFERPALSLDPLYRTGFAVASKP